MEKRIIELLEAIFERQTLEKQSKILTQLSCVLPVEATEIEWKIGAGYDEEKNEIGLSFSPILSQVQSKNKVTFGQIIEAYLFKSKELELAEIIYRLLGFLEDAKVDTIRIFCIPSGFVEKKVYHTFAWRLPQRPKQNKNIRLVFEYANKQ